MKTLVSFLVLLVLSAVSALADIRSCYVSDPVGHRERRHDDRRNGYSNRYDNDDHGYRHSDREDRNDYRSNYSYRSWDDEYYPRERIVVVRPKLPRVSKFAPTFSPTSGWKTSRWYQREPVLVTSPDTIRDARSAEQLTEIYGGQATSLFR